MLYKLSNGPATLHSAQAEGIRIVYNFLRKKYGYKVDCHQAGPFTIRTQYINRKRLFSVVFRHPVGSVCTYFGKTQIKNLQYDVTFEKVSQKGLNKLIYGFNRSMYRTFIEHELIIEKRRI